MIRNLHIISLIVLGLSLAVKADTFWVGVTPWQKGQSVDDINRLYLPLLDYLSKETGNKFKLKAMDSYEETISEISKGTIQLAVLSPIPYVKAKKIDPRIELLVTELSMSSDQKSKNDSYRSYIMVNKNRKDLNSITSLKGKSIGFVSESSTSGYVVPMAYLQKNKIVPEKYFSKISILGSHPAVTDALAMGSIDAGVTWDFNWQQAKLKYGDIYRTLWTSEPIPNLCIVAHETMPQRLRVKIRSLLVKIPENLIRGLSAVGYVEREDSFYDGVRLFEK